MEDSSSEPDKDLLTELVLSLKEKQGTERKQVQAMVDAIRESI